MPSHWSYYPEKPTLRPPFLLKALAVMISVVFLSQELLYGASIAVAVPHSLHYKIPAALGRIESYHRGTSDKTIIFVQDAHDSIEAQLNIARIIQHAVAKQGVKTVFEEGYEGLVPTNEIYQSLTDPLTREAVSYYLLDHLRIGGAEYAHINRLNKAASFPLSSPPLYGDKDRGEHNSVRAVSSPHILGGDLISRSPIKDFGDAEKHGDFKLIGADSIKGHFENVRWFQRTIKQKAPALQDIDLLITEFQRLADEQFPKPVKAYLKLKQRFDAEQMDLLDYLRRARPRVSEKTLYPTIDLLLKVDQVNRPATRKEIEGLAVQDLFQEMQQMDEEIAASFFKERKIAPVQSSVIHALERCQGQSCTQRRRRSVIPAKAGISTQGASLLKSKIDSRLKPAGMTPEYEVFSSLQHLSRVKRLLAFKMTPAELNAVKKDMLTFDTKAMARLLVYENNRSAVFSKTWELAVRDAMQFYEAALKRETTAETQLTNFIKQSREKNAVLVYGGFHRQGIETLLARQGVSYYVVSPTIREEDTYHSKLYQQLMGQGYEINPLAKRERNNVRGDRKEIVEGSRPADLPHAARVISELEYVRVGGAESQDQLVQFHQSLQRAARQVLRQSQGRIDPPEYVSARMDQKLKSAAYRPQFSSRSEVRRPEDLSGIAGSEISFTEARAKSLVEPVMISDQVKEAVLRKAPQLVQTVKWEEKLGMIRTALGASDQEMLNFFRAFPRVITYSPRILKRKWTLIKELVSEREKPRRWEGLRTLIALNTEALEMIWKEAQAQRRKIENPNHLRRLYEDLEKTVRKEHQKSIAQFLSGEKTTRRGYVRPPDVPSEKPPASQLLPWVQEVVRRLEQRSEVRMGAKEPVMSTQRLIDQALQTLVELKTSSGKKDQIIETLEFLSALGVEEAVDAIEPYIEPDIHTLATETAIRALGRIGGAKAFNHLAHYAERFISEAREAEEKMWLRPGVRKNVDIPAFIKELSKIIKINIRVLQQVDDIKGTQKALEFYRDPTTPEAVLKAIHRGLKITPQNLYLVQAMLDQSLERGNNRVFMFYNEIALLGGPSLIPWLLAQENKMRVSGQREHPALVFIHLALASVGDPVARQEFKEQLEMGANSSLLSRYSLYQVTLERIAREEPHYREHIKAFFRKEFERAAEGRLKLGFALTLADLEDPSVIEYLMERWQTAPDKDLKQTIEAALFFSADSKTLPFWLSIYRKTERLSRENMVAVMRLGQIDTPETVSALADMLRDSDSDKRQIAYSLLYEKQARLHKIPEKKRHTAGSEIPGGVWVPVRIHGQDSGRSQALKELLDRGILLTREEGLRRMPFWAAEMTKWGVDKNDIYFSPIRDPSYVLQPDHTPGEQKVTDSAGRALVFSRASSSYIVKYSGAQYPHVLNGGLAVPFFYDPSHWFYGGDDPLDGGFFDREISNGVAIREKLSEAFNGDAVFQSAKQEWGIRENSFLEPMIRVEPLMIPIASLAEKTLFYLPLSQVLPMIGVNEEDRKKFRFQFYIYKNPSGLDLRLASIFNSPFSETAWRPYLTSLGITVTEDKKFSYKEKSITEMQAKELVALHAVRRFALFLRLIHDHLKMSGNTEDESDIFTLQNVSPLTVFDYQNFSSGNYTDYNLRHDLMGGMNVLENVAKEWGLSSKRVRQLRAVFRDILIKSGDPIRSEVRIDDQASELITKEDMDLFLNRVGTVLGTLPQDFSYQNALDYEFVTEAQVLSRLGAPTDETNQIVVKTYRERGWMMGSESVESDAKPRPVHSRVYWINPENPNFRFSALLENIKRGIELMAGIYDQRDMEQAVALIEKHLTRAPSKPKALTVGLAAFETWRSLTEDMLTQDHKLAQRSEVRRPKRSIETNFLAEKKFRKEHTHPDFPRNLPWGSAHISAEKGIAEVIHALNQWPFLYTSSWSHSGLPSDHAQDVLDERLGRGERELLERVRGILPENQRFTQGKHSAFISFRADYQNADYLKFERRLRKLPGVQVIDSPVSGPYGLEKLIWITVPEAIVALNQEQLYEEYLKKQWQKVLNAMAKAQAATQKQAAPVAVTKHNFDAMDSMNQLESAMNQAVEGKPFPADFVLPPLQRRALFEGIQNKVSHWSHVPGLIRLYALAFYFLERTPSLVEMERFEKLITLYNSKIDEASPRSVFYLAYRQSIASIFSLTLSPRHAEKLESDYVELTHHLLNLPGKYKYLAISRELLFSAIHANTAVETVDKKAVAPLAAFALQTLLQESVPEDLGGPSSDEAGEILEDLHYGFINYFSVMGQAVLGGDSDFQTIRDLFEKNKNKFFKWLRDLQKEEIEKGFSPLDEKVEYDYDLYEWFQKIPAPFDDVLFHNGDYSNALKRWSIDYQPARWRIGYEDKIDSRMSLILQSWTPSSRAGQVQFSKSDPAEKNNIQPVNKGAPVSFTLHFGGDSVEPEKIIVRARYLFPTRDRIFGEREAVFQERTGEDMLRYGIALPTSEYRLKVSFDFGRSWTKIENSKRSEVRSERRQPSYPIVTHGDTKIKVSGEEEVGIQPQRVISSTMQPAQKIENLVTPAAVFLEADELTQGAQSSVTRQINGLMALLSRHKNFDIYVNGDESKIQNSRFKQLLAEYRSRIHLGPLEGRATLPQKKILVNVSFFESRAPSLRTRQKMQKLKKAYGLIHEPTPLEYTRAGALKGFLDLAESLTAETIRKLPARYAVRTASGYLRMNESYLASIWTELQNNYVFQWAA